jgi:hypothetical protein
LIDFFDFNDLVLNKNACFDIRFSRDNNVRSECTSSLNDDQILDRKRKNKNDDCHDHDEFDEIKTIDADIEKFIDRVIDSFFEIEFDEHDVVRLSIIFSILLVFRVEIEMKVQNQNVIINEHLDDHFSYILQRFFESSNVIDDVLIDD